MTTNDTGDNETQQLGTIGKRIVAKAGNPNVTGTGNDEADKALAAMGFTKK